MSEQIDTAISWATDQLAAYSDSARLDAELLLAHCLNKPRSYLYTWPEKPLDFECSKKFAELIEQRKKPTPIAYLLGAREFYSLDFISTADALVPRPETELLVELTLEQIGELDEFRVIDLGTGTGIIAVTLKHFRPGLEMWATDLDPACIKLARHNAEQHGVEINFITSNWFQALPDIRFDFIVSNPPYIAAEHPFLLQGDLPGEPSLALTPGDTGTEALQTIIEKAPLFLRPAGRILLEHGYDQQSAVAQLLQHNGFTEIRCHNDLNQLPRVTSAKLVENPEIGG
ncbi:MAG: peptide chain release factor N(5)-glutamine methyltransferase [Pseudomonadota bacterium]